MDIYQRIKYRREELEMSQDELAKRIGYKDRTAVCKMEAGQRQIKQGMIVALADALHTTPAWLMGWEDEETEQISDEDRMILEAYHHSSDGIRESVRILLGIKGEVRSSTAISDRKEA